MKHLLPALLLALALPALALDTEISDTTDASLRSALVGADSGDTITFHPSLSGATITLTGGQIAIGESLTIDASALPLGITISGDNNSRVFDITGDIDVVLDSLSITNGKSATSADGGAIYVSGGSASLKLKNTTVANSTTGDGTNGLMNADRGGNGGGIFNDGGTVTIVNSTISGNTTGKGGTPSDSFMYSGGAGGDGGGIFTDGGTLVIENSTIADNTCGPGVNGVVGGVGGYGGGITIVGNATVTVRNSTITGNTTGDTGGPGTPSGSGGGIYHQTGTLTLANSIVAENELGDAGGGLSSYGPDINVANGQLQTPGPNLFGDNSGTGVVTIPASPLVGTAGAPLDPGLGALGGPAGSPAVRIPDPGSPAIGAGANAQLPLDTCDVDGDDDTGEVLPLDQRGQARVSGPRVDLGSVEDQLTFPLLQARNTKLKKQIDKTKKQVRKAKTSGKKAKLAKALKNLKKLTKKARKLKKQMQST